MSDANRPLYAGDGKREDRASGYAIEYDFFDPRDLKPTLESNLSRGCSLLVRLTALPVTKKRCARFAGRS